jgi:phosphate transport system protein
MDELKKSVLTLGGLVEESIELGAKALREQDAHLGAVVAADDDAIDDMELQIENECLKLLALYQPVAEDLRFLCAVMKINNDLERLGDLAASMARRGGRIGQLLPPELVEQFDTMAREVIRMLRNVLRAFVERDPTAARLVVKYDDTVDGLHRAMLERVIAYMKLNPAHVEAGVHLVWVSRNLERIADHITNIGEDIVYMVEGETIRHQLRGPRSETPANPANNVLTLKSPES